VASLQKLLDFDKVVENTFFSRNSIFTVSSVQKKKGGKNEEKTKQKQKRKTQKQPNLHLLCKGRDQTCPSELASIAKLPSRLLEHTCQEATLHVTTGRQKLSPRLPVSVECLWPVHRY